MATKLSVTFNITPDSESKLARKLLKLMWMEEMESLNSVQTRRAVMADAGSPGWTYS